MKKSASLTYLLPLIGLLAGISALAGLFWQSNGSPYIFTTLHGQTVQIDGTGLYRNDTLMSAATFRGTDVVILLVGIPLLLMTSIGYKRGSLRSGVALTGILAVFLYYGISMTFSAAFNQLFLVYVALFSACLFSFIILMTSIDHLALARQINPQLSMIGIANFLIIIGIGTLVLWMSDVVGPLTSGIVPEHLGSYTTMFTHAFDSAVITPAAIMSGILLLRRNALGYLFTFPLLILCIIIGVIVIAQTISQTLVGIIFPVGVYIGMIGSWVVMGGFAIVFTLNLLRNIRE